MTGCGSARRSWPAPSRRTCGRPCDGVATKEGLDAALAAKHELMSLYEGTPYRPTGLAAPDQALVSLISLLEWCTSLTCEAVDGHLDLSGAAAPDLDLLAEASAALAACAECLDGGDELPNPERVWKARLASAMHLRGLTGEPASVRLMADHAFHAQAIGIAASAAAADTLIAAGRVSAAGIAAQRHRWLAAPVDLRPPTARSAPTALSHRRGWRCRRAASAAAPLASVAAAAATGRRDDRGRRQHPLGLVPQQRPGRGRDRRPPSWSPG